jgi:hypothetical protein
MSGQLHAPTDLPPRNYSGTLLTGLCVNPGPVSVLWSQNRPLSVSGSAPLYTDAAPTCHSGFRKWRFTGEGGWCCGGNEPWSSTIKRDCIHHLSYYQLVKDSTVVLTYGARRDKWSSLGSGLIGAHPPEGARGGAPNSSPVIYISLFLLRWKGRH